MKTQGDPSAGQGGVRREESVRQVLQRAGSSQDSQRGHSPRQGEAGHRVWSVSRIRFWCVSNARSHITKLNGVRIRLHPGF